MQNQLGRRSTRGERGEESLENTCHVRGSGNSNNVKQLCSGMMLFKRNYMAEMLAKGGKKSLSRL